MDDGADTNATFYTTKDGHKIIVLGDFGSLDEGLRKHMGLTIREAITVVGGIIDGSPERRQAMLDTFADIYGKRVPLLEELYSPKPDTKPLPRGKVPEFIKERNRTHWKKGRR